MIGASRGLTFASLALAAVLVSAPAQAACTVAPESVLFGTYDTLDEAAMDGVGAIRIACDAPTDLTVALGQGGGSIQARQMTDGAHILGYNLYTDVSRLTVWGDGATAGATVSASGTDVDLPVYARIPPRQTVPAGEYWDVLVVTVEF